MRCEKKLVIWFSGRYDGGVTNGQRRLIAECSSSFSRDCGFFVELIDEDERVKTDEEGWDLSDDTVLRATLAHLDHIKQRERGST